MGSYDGIRKDEKVHEAKVVWEGKSSKELQSIKEEWDRMLVFFSLHVYVSYPVRTLPLTISVYSPSSPLPSGGPSTG